MNKVGRLPEPGEINLLGLFDMSQGTNKRKSVRTE
jgi:hypothetical protein